MKMHILLFAGIFLLIDGLWNLRKAVHISKKGKHSCANK